MSDKEFGVPLLEPGHMDQTRFDEIAARLADPELSFVTGLHKTLANTMFSTRNAETGAIDEQAFDEPDIAVTTGAVQAIENNADPEGRLTPAARDLKIIQALERTIVNDPTPSKFQALCVLGFIAARNKPVTIRPAIKEAALDPTGIVRKPARETAQEKVFRTAITVLRRRAYPPQAELNRLASYQQQAGIVRGREAIADQAAALYGVPDKAVPAMLFVNATRLWKFALDVLYLVFRDNVNAEEVADEVFVATRLQAALTEAPPEVAVEALGWAPLPPGTLAEWGMESHTAGPGRPLPGESKGPVLQRERFVFAANLLKAFGLGARVAARPLNKTPGKAVPAQPEQSTGQETAGTEKAEFNPENFNQKEYLVLIRPREVAVPEEYGGGTITIEDAVGVCAMTNNAVIIWRGENGVIDGEIVETWQDVFRFNKPNAYGRYPVRRLIYTPTALERTLAELDKPLDAFNEHVTHNP